MLKENKPKLNIYYLQSKRVLWLWVSLSRNHVLGEEKWEHGGTATQTQRALSLFMILCTPLLMVIFLLLETKFLSTVFF